MRANGSFAVGEWLVEPPLNRISCAEETHYLRPQVMNLLVYLAERSGEVVSTDDLLAQLWEGRIVSHGVVYNCVAELRQALVNGHDPGARIDSIPKKGYRLVARVDGVARKLPASTGAVAGKRGLWSRIRRPWVLAAGCGALVATAVLLHGIVQSPRSLSATSIRQLSASRIVFPPVPSSFPLVSDGARLYFNDWESGELGLRQMLIAGGEAIRMESPFSDPDVLINPHAISPDGKSLLISSFTPGVWDPPSLWLWPLLAGAPRRIGSGVAAAFSPDGSRIVYSTVRGELLIDDLQMQAPQRLATLPGRIFWLAFSPDGVRVRFSVSRHGGLPTAIWEVPAEGGEATRLFPEWSARVHCCGSWTPDADHYVFQVVSNGHSQLWATTERAGWPGNAGMRAYPLTTGPIDFRRPLVSADGERVFAAGWQLRGEVVRYDSVSKTFSAVGELDTDSAEWLAYSNDRVAYVSYPDAALWVRNRDGGEPRQISFAPLVASNPSWSPDGQRIAFEGQTPGAGKRVFLAELPSGNVAMAMPGDAAQYSPTWSPDGSAIAFGEQGADGIRTLDLASGIVSTLPGSEALYRPRWSPDGIYIAAIGEQGIELYNTGSGSREVIAEHAPIENHFWSASGRQVFFYEPFWRGSARSLYKVDIRSQVVEHVLATAGVRSTWGVDGMWIGRTANDEPAFLRDLSIHHIYQINLAR